MGIEFEWDPAKADGNLRKHGVTFEEGSTVFLDEEALLIADPDHSRAEEDRFLLLGFSARARLLVVVHCLRESGRVIRLISARRATRRESEWYVGRSPR